MKDRIALLESWKDMNEALRRLPGREETIAEAAREGPALTAHATKIMRTMVDIWDKHGKRDTDAMERSAKRLREDLTGDVDKLFGGKAKRKRPRETKKTVH